MIRTSTPQDTSGLDWFKSSYSSSGDGNDCVEVASAPGTVHVRDSKHTTGLSLKLTLEAWASFVPYASES
ncbi:hypothetical protein RKD19_003022 [Streptomyces canus]|uniref:DUF397 domain-containing protein n=1 Tax=Streptomyces sp. RP5T TaxID=2490848 RepID=UPI000F64A9DA|nr:DUF397 domain-containing protein [Streptomyces sp. RP5T]RRR69506.1 DUF397 domain-containing protein [Streptomyces sp. RP5T]